MKRSFKLLARSLAASSLATAGMIAGFNLVAAAQQAPDAPISPSDNNQLQNNPAPPAPMQLDPARPDATQPTPMRPAPMRPAPMRDDNQLQNNPAPPASMQLDPARPDATQPAPMRPAPMRPAPMRPDQTQLAPAQPSGAEFPSPPQASVSVPDDSASLSIDAIVERSDSFNIFNSLLRVADRNGELSRQLAGGGTYTVFAPTDAAFAALPEGTIKKLVQPENRSALIKILSYHVVPGKMASSAIQSGTQTSVEGSSLNVQVGAGSVTVNDAQVIRPDIEASNGVIHAVNKVILPPDIQAGLIATPQASRSMNPAY